MDLFKLKAALGDFDSKIKAAKALRVVTDDEHKLLNALQRVRNLFAHPHGIGLSFDQPNARLTQALGELVTSPGLFLRIGLQSSGDFSSLQGRYRFIHAVYSLFLLLRHLRDRAEAGLDFRLQ